MFRIVSVGKGGFFSTSVIVETTCPMALEEQRIKHDLVGAPMLETWQLSIAAGERFEVHLPHVADARESQLLPLAALQADKSLRSKWTKVSSL